MYNQEIAADNFTMVTTQYSYRCGCPAGWTYSNGTCNPCSTIGKDCPCPEGWTWFNGTCVTCQSVGKKNCFSCNQLPNYFG